MWQLLLTLAFNLTLNFQGQIKYLICYILWQNDPIALKRPQKHLKFIMTLTCYFQGQIVAPEGWQGRLMWNKKEVNRLVAEPTTWRWPVTICMALTMDFQGQSLK